jgi:hypothetical protein
MPGAEIIPLRLAIPGTLNLLCSNSSFFLQGFGPFMPGFEIIHRPFHPLDFTPTFLQGFGPFMPGFEVLPRSSICRSP